MFRRRQQPEPLRLSSAAREADTPTTDLGLVHGSAVVGVNVWKEAVSAVTDVFGGRSASLEATVDQGIALALATMETRARERGAEAVRDVRVDVEQMGGRGGRGGHLIVIAVGTAVRGREVANPPRAEGEAPIVVDGLPPFRPGS